MFSRFYLCWVQTKKNIHLGQRDPPLSSAPTTSGPEWASASPQTYSSCHWEPTDSQFYIHQRQKRRRRRR